MKTYLALHIFALASWNIGTSLELGKVTKVKTPKLHLGRVKKLPQTTLSPKSSLEKIVEYDIFAFGKDFRLDFTANEELLPNGFKVKIR